MKIEIQYLDEPWRGKRLEFEGESEIRFGRDRDVCQVWFDPHERAVSREHCAIRRVLGRYRLYLNGEVPVELDGRWARDGDVLGRSSRLRLGANGPRLRIQTVHREGDLATTVTEGDPSSADDKKLRRGWPRALWSSVSVLLGVLVLAGRP